MKKFLAVLFIFLFPATVFGAEFVQQPLFLSKSPVTEGQKVRIYANVSNESSTTFSGSVVISADGVKIGAPTASLAVGATQTVSVSWIPTAGTHTVTAQLVAEDGAVIEHVSQPFSILAIPQPIATSSSSDSRGISGVPYQSSNQIQQAIANLSPTVATTTKPVFSGIDGLRQYTASALATQIVTTRGTIAKDHAASSTASTVTADAWTSYLWLLILLRILIASAPIFYIFLTILFIYIIWRIYKKIRGPRY